jgi:hypothetical protein
MKRLSNFLSFCLASTLFNFCKNADRTKTFTQDINHITSDELVYEIESADMQIAPQLITPDPAEKAKGSRLNSSIFKEMFFVTQPSTYE